jgi:hypothetical protein
MILKLKKTNIMRKKKFLRFLFGIIIPMVVAYYLLILTTKDIFPLVLSAQTLIIWIILLTIILYILFFALLRRLLLWGLIKMLLKGDPIAYWKW